VLRGGKKAGAKVSDIRCPMINHGGADALVRFKCIVEPELSNPPRGPTTPCIRFADLIHRFNDARGARDSPPVTLETEPRIGERDCDLIGHSYELPVILAYLMAKHGRPKTSTIIATGRLVVKSGTVGIVDAFERKIDLLLEAAPYGSLFIYPKGNVAKENTAVREKLERLKNVRGVRCIPIEKLDDIKFLWKRCSAIFAIRVGAVLFAPLVVVGLFLLLVTSQNLNPTLDPIYVGVVVFDKSINTASPDGAYQSSLCPRLLGVLSNAKSQGHKCTPSNGSPENIARGLENPTNFGYVQYDVWLRMAGDQVEVEKKLFLIHEDIVCEGLWMVTKNPDLTRYSQILESARDITFILPHKDSGPAWTFNYLRSKDAELNRVSRLQNEKNPAAVLEKVAKSSKQDKVVGFYVQFATVDNANIKRMAEGFNVIPLDRKEITDVRERGLIPYSSRTFILKSGSMLTSAREVSTACVKVGLITGRPEAFSSERERKAQSELIDAVQKNIEKLRPREGTVSDYFETFKEQLGRVAG